MYGTAKTWTLPEYCTLKAVVPLSMQRTLGSFSGPANNGNPILTAFRVLGRPLGYLIFSLMALIVGSLGYCPLSLAVGEYL